MSLEMGSDPSSQIMHIFNKDLFSHQLQLPEFGADEPPLSFTNNTRSFEEYS